MDRTLLYQKLLDDLGGPKKAAIALKVAQSTASGWKLGQHGMSARTAIRAEQLTKGRYKAVDLSAELSDLKR